MYVCRLWVSNLERSTHRVLNVVIGTPKPWSRQFEQHCSKNEGEDRFFVISTYSQFYFAPPIRILLCADKINLKP